ncbi:MAG: hypothetical protein HOP30_01880 [Cyclobacteriaceae bacterium]|nr:hypothetical protein [Cyclobacteriaceae bacterium]
MKLNLLLLLVTTSTLAFGQSDYAITLKGDTLKGRVKILTYDQLDRIQVVIENKKKSYSALEIRIIRMEGSIYHTVKYDNGFRYMKLMKEGFLSLYGFRMPNQSTYDGFYFLKKDGSGLEMPNLTFKKSLSNFLAECPEVSDRIKSGDLGRKDIDLIVDRFNSCLQFKTERRVDEPKIPVVTEKESEQMMAVNAIITKAEAATNLENKSDIIDLLKDLRSKIARNEILPNYILKDIKNQLGQNPEFSADVEKLMLLVKK